MKERSSVKTIGYATGIGVLLLVLFLVAGITTGLLPWRDSYASASQPQGDDGTVVVTTATPEPQHTPQPSQSPTPEATPTPTPTSTPVIPETVPDGTLDEELPTHIVTVTFGRGGTAMPYGMSKVVENGSITVVAVPNEGYAVENMIIDGISMGPIDSYVLDNITEDHSFYISFVRKIFEQETPAPTEAPTPTPVPTPTPTPVPTPTPIPETVVPTE